MLNEILRRSGDRGRGKKYWSKYDERNEWTYSISSRNCKQDEIKDFYNERNYSQIVKSKYRF